MIARLIAADARLSARMVLDERPGPLRTLASILAHSGDSWFWGLLLAALYWRGGEGWQHRAVVQFFGILGAAALVQTMKLVFRRRRPKGNWGQIYRRTDPHSFPSGHAARMWMLAALGIALGPAWWAAMLLVWAPLVTLARVVMGVHYVSDVAVGAALGLLVGVGIAFTL